MTEHHDPTADDQGNGPVEPTVGANVRYLAVRREPTTPTPADEVIEGELVSEEEYRQLTSEKAKAVERYRGYQRDVVTLYRGTRSTARVVVAGARVGGRVTWRFTRRHGAIIVKGAEAERQRRKAERQQGDARAARAAALDRGDVDQVAALNQQIQQARQVQVAGLAQWVDLVWSVTKKVALTLAIVVGLVLVTGLVNDVCGWFGTEGWFGAWGIREVVVTIGTVLTTVGTAARWVGGHWWVFALVGLGMWLFRRWKDGKRLGEHVLPESLRKTGRRAAYVELSESAVVSALANIGHAKLNAVIKDGWPHRDTDHAWVQPPMIDARGKWWSVKLRLPLGASVAAVGKAKDLLAHNLGCRPPELFIEADADDPTVLELCRLEPGVLREPVPEHPLLHEGATDFWKGFPVGITPRGTPVVCPVNERNFVVTGAMGSGKTTLVVDLLLAAILDPLVDIDVFVFAENNDYDALKPCLNTLVKGDTKDTVERCIEHLTELQADLNTRGKLLHQHGVSSVNQAGRDLVGREPGLRPRIVVIDECQAFFRQDSPAERQAIVNMMVRFYSAARKYGVVCLFATPLPSDQSLPRDLVAVTSNKACGAIGDKLRNNIALGDKAHENGISALGLKPATDRAANDAGTLITVGFMDNPGALRCYNPTAEQKAQIVDRAVQARGGPISPTEPDQPAQRDWLADLAAVCPTEHDKQVRLTDAAGWLRKHAPDHRPYRGLDGKTLAAWLTEINIPVSWAARQPKVLTQSIHAVLAARDTHGGE